MAYRKVISLLDTIGLRAVFYARVSTAEEEQLNAIELQIEENRNCISKNKWKKVDEYIDRSKSGTVLQEAMAGRAAGQQILVAWMNKNKKFQKEQLTAEGYSEFKEFYKEALK